MSSAVPSRSADAADRVGPSPRLPWLPPTWVLAVGLVAVAANLRLSLAGLPPLAPQIAADLHLSSAAAGILTALPVLCMGVFAPPAHWASIRWGSAPTVWAAVLVLTLGAALRLLGGSVPVLYLASLLVGVGIAVAGTLLPRLVKTLFPAERAGLITGVYMLAMMVGATTSSALAAPLADRLGSWQGSLASWSLVGVVGLVAWAPLATRVWTHRAEVTAGRPDAHLPWRHPTAWLVAAYLATQSFAFYSVLAWLSPSFEQLGWDRAHAGYLLSVFSAVQIATGLLMPVVSDRVADLRLLLVPTALCAGAGLLGLAVAPEAAAWLWAALVGFGQGSAFALALVVLVRMAVTPHASGGLSAMGFLVGYVAAAFGPLSMGALRDATGGFRAVWVVLVGLALAQLAVCLRLSPRLARVGDV